MQRYSCCVEQKEGEEVFAEFGVLNFWTYVVGAFFIVLVPGPNTLFVLKTGIGHGVKKGYLAATGVFIGDAVLMFLAWAAKCSGRSLPARITLRKAAPRLPARS